MDLSSCEVQCLNGWGIHDFAYGCYLRQFMVDIHLARAVGG